MNIKIKLLQYCNAHVNERIDRCRDAIQFAQEAANAEEKSSAGDKYETGRAMAQIERDNATSQLEEVLKLKDVLDKINPSIQATRAGLGSLIVSDKANFYIAISIGSVTLNEGHYFVISQESPIGKMLLGKSVGDSFTFNKEIHHILEVY